MVEHRMSYSLPCSGGDGCSYATRHYQTLWRNGLSIHSESGRSVVQTLTKSYQRLKMECTPSLLDTQHLKMIEHGQTTIDW